MEMATTGKSLMVNTCDLRNGEGNVYTHMYIYIYIHTQTSCMLLAPLGFRSQNFKKMMGFG